jgi:HD-GYP domain-containing protein (c-di-GMP phosphodiesterase class II)/DNA-binding CsgD family transcriptional regulator
LYSFMKGRLYDPVGRRRIGEMAYAGPALWRRSQASSRIGRGDVCSGRVSERATDAIRLADILAALSLATDIANGNPMESGLRACLIAAGLARDVGGSGEEASDAYYASMLRHLGCTSVAHEEAAAFGDDLAARQVYAPIDPTRTGELLAATLGQLGRGEGAVGRVRAVATAIGGRSKLRRQMVQGRCEVGVRLSDRLGMGAGVARALEQSYERWDGAGMPGAVEGEGISLAARVMHVAIEVELATRRGGRKAACAVVRRRRGGQFDPRIADAFLERAPEILASVEAESVWDEALEAEPAPQARAAGRIDEIARAFADYVDLKSVYTLGHSSGVAALAAAAGQAAGMGEEACTALERAALLHDLGRVAVSTGVWEKKGPLSAAEWERVRLHGYFTERILSCTPALAALAPIAGAHHERIDGSGYHKSSPAALQSTSARILAAADSYHAMTEQRPHRPPLAVEDAVRTLEEEVSAGRLDRVAVAAVLDAAGHGVRRTRSAWPAGLSDREVEVLRLVAQGSSTKEVAARLDISPRTAQHHVVHIYDKIGVSSRAAAALFAIENDLIRLERNPS